MATKIGDSMLMYDPKRKIIICTYHQCHFALQPKIESIIDHLKSPNHRLGAAQLNPIVQLIADGRADGTITLNPKEAVMRSSIRQSLVPYLKAHAGFACTHPDCLPNGAGHTTDARSQKTRQHCAAAHPGIDYQDLIQSVKLQRFYVKSPWFIADESLPTSIDSTPVDVTDVSALLMARFDETVAADAAAYCCFEDANQEIHTATKDKWFTTTGIHHLFSNLERQRIAELPKYIANNPRHTLLYNTVYTTLKNITLNLTQGHIHERTDDCFRQLLQSFEAGRESNKPFVPHARSATLEHYSQHWTKVLILALNIVEPKNEDYRRALFPNFNLLPAADIINQLSSALSTIPTERTSCQSTTVPSLSFDSAVDLDDDIHNNSMVASDTVDLGTITRLTITLSTELARHEICGRSFDSPILVFFATQCLTETHTFRDPSTTTTILSALVYCTQLWIAHYVLDCSRISESTISPLECLRLEHDRFIHHRTSSPLAVCNKWRLQAHYSPCISTVPATHLNQTGDVVIHGRHEINLSQWRSFLQETMRSSLRILREELLFGIEVSDIPLATLKDDFTIAKANHSFVDDKRNNTADLSHRLWLQVSNTPQLYRKFYNPLNPSEVIRSAATQYLDAQQRFLQQMLVLIHATGGLPARRPELLATQFKNTSLRRHIYIEHGLICIARHYHKTSHRTGHRPTAWFLPPAVSHLLVQYLVYIPRIADHFHRELGHPLLDITRGFLFVDRHGAWLPERVTRYFGNQVRAAMGVNINIATWRHMAIAIDRRQLRGEGIALHEIDEAVERNRDSTTDADNDDLHHTQATHTVDVGNTHYGNHYSLTEGMHDNLLHGYYKVSIAWHHYFQVDVAPGLAICIEYPEPISTETIFQTLGQRRLYRAKPESKVIKMEWTSERVQSVLQVLHGHRPAPKSIQQERALRNMSDLTADNIIVIPTGGGKSMLFMVPPLMPQAGVTVVIIPLVALMQDIVSRIDPDKLPFTQWTSGVTAANLKTNLVFMTIEHAISSMSLLFLKTLCHNKRLERIIFDEAHLILTAAKYREVMSRIHTLREIECSFVWMTGTLPLQAESILANAVGMSNHDISITRQYCDRPNLKYVIKRVSSSSELMTAITRFLANLLSQYQHDTTTRIICYVRTVSQAEELSYLLQCCCYHGRMVEAGRNDQYTRWKTGISNGKCTQPRLIIGTSALSAGIDHAHVRHVVHLDGPSSLIDYAQETGRAGRDGQPATCTMFVSQDWQPNSFLYSQQNEYLAYDCGKLIKFIDSRTCLRNRLTKFLNNGAGITCPKDSPESMCSICTQHRLPAEEPVTPTVQLDNEYGGMDLDLSDNEIIPTSILTSSSISQPSQATYSSPILSHGRSSSIVSSAQTTALTRFTGPAQNPSRHRKRKANAIPIAPEATISSNTTHTSSNSQQSISQKRRRQLPWVLSNDKSVPEEISSSSDDAEPAPSSSTNAMSLAHSSQLQNNRERQARWELFQQIITTWQSGCIYCSFTDKIPILAHTSLYCPKKDVIRQLAGDLRQRMKNIGIPNFMFCLSCYQSQGFCSRPKTNSPSRCDRYGGMFIVEMAAVAINLDTAAALEKWAIVARGIPYCNNAPTESVMKLDELEPADRNDMLNSFAKFLMKYDHRTIEDQGNSLQSFILLWFTDLGDRYRTLSLQ